MITDTTASDAAISPVISTGTVTKKAAEVKGILGEFDTLLKATLAPDKSNKVSEEELFAAVVKERLEALKGKDTADKFSSALDTESAKLKKPDGFVSLEQATINALKGLVNDKTLTEDEGSQVYSEAFAASQLDDNKDALFDSRSGPGDPTAAMATLEVALKQARGVIENLASDASALTLKSLANAKANGKPKITSATVASAGGTSSVVSGTFSPNGIAFDGPDGFLFKPVTNNEGKLAVLLGQNLTGNISSVKIKDSLNNVLEEGKLQTAGIKETGREKWNFSKQGGNYPKDIAVEVTLSSGEVQRFKIPDPSKRYD